LIGLPVTVVAEHIRPERLFSYLLGLRASHGLHILPSDGPMIGLFRALKRGEVIGLACDRAVTETARSALFFGCPARLPRGPVELARRSGAPLVAAHALRLPDESFHIRVEPPIEIEPTDDPEADLAAGMDRLVAIMERWIASNPDQWLISVPIWQPAEVR
jgi:KDO2-lipid IV(A) lauroyltransferase